MRAPLRTSPAKAGERVASYDGVSLEHRLVAAGASAGQARSAAGKALRHLFRGGGRRDIDGAAERWTDDALAAQGIGGIARALLLELDVRPSLAVEQIAPSIDDAIRLVLRTVDGRLIESVIIPGPRRT